MLEAWQAFQDGMDLTEEQTRRVISMITRYMNENWDKLSSDAKIAGANLIIGLVDGSES